MKRTLFFMFCLLFLFCWNPMVEAAAEPSDPLILAQDGKALCPIVVSDHATPVELTAAKELQLHLNQIIGGTFEILKESQVGEDVAQILIGSTERLKKWLPDLKPDDFAYDEILIKTLPDNKLILTGHEQRGSLYAVNTFLEDVLGVRWWTSQEGDAPVKLALEIPPLEVRYAPRLIYRESFYVDAFDGLFATRMKCNGASEQIPSEYGNHHKFVYFVHSFYPLLPPEKYFEQHPEWYSEIDGKRTHDHAQLCLTNEEMKKELIVNAKEMIRKNPDAGFISISQNDWYGHCQCEKCKAIDEAEGSPSGLMLRFVNDVAEEIEKDFPEMWVETLAYQYTRKPPQITKPRHNVIVRLCSIECSFVQPLTGEQNKSFHDDIVGWNEIAPQLFIWDYVTSFSNYIIPHPNMRVLAPNIRFFVDHGTIGLFEQGDYHCNIGDFVGVRNYVISHLLWDQNRDEMELFHEFMNGYYRNAAPYLVEYLKLIHDTAEQSGLHIGCFRDDTSAWLDLDTLNQATALFEKALNAVKDDLTAWERVRKAKMTIDHVWLIQYDDFLLQARQDNKPFHGPADAQAACKEFFELCRKWNTTAFREWNHSMDEYEEKLMEKLMGNPVP